MNNLNHLRLAFVLSAIVLAFIHAPMSLRAQDATEKVTFDDHVKPIFRQRCATCHGPDKKSGGLDVTNFTALMQGGGSGASIEPGDAEGSYLYMLVTHEEEPSMPPGGNKIPDGELSMISKWIDAGALENMSSKASVKKKSFDTAMSGDAATRPEQVALPPHLPMEPVIHTEKTSTATAIAMSPWAPIVAIAAPKQVLLYNTQTLEFLGVLEFPEGIANVLKFSRNGQLLIAGGGQDAVSGKVVVWDVATGRRELEVGDELDTVLAADISSDHRFIALGGPKRIVRVFSTSDGSQVYEITKHTDWITSLAFSPDGVLLATGDRAGGTFVWEAPTGNPFLDLRGHTAQITGISWRTDSNILATCSEDTSVRLWEMENGSQVKTFNAHGGGTSEVVFTRDGNLATNGRDKVAKVWNQNGELQKQMSALDDIGTAIGYCNETGRVVAGDWTGKYYVWNFSDAVLVGELSPNPPLLAERVAIAQSQVQQTQGELAPVAVQLTEATAAMEQLRMQMQGIEATKATLTTEVAALEQQLATAKQSMESKAAEAVQTKTELDSHTTIQPQLKELSEKATAVAALSPTDPELQTTAQTLVAKLTSVDARMTELNTRIAQLTNETTTTQQEIEAMTQTFGTKQIELESANTQLTTMTTQMPPLEAAVAEKTTIVSQIREKVAAAEVALARWQNEVSFISQLAAIDAKIEAAQIEADNAAEARSALEAKLAALQAEISIALATEQAANQSLEAAQTERDAVQGIVQ